MNRIKELRAENGMTQAELARILGVNQTAVGKYERGELEPNVHNLIRMADLFKCSVDYLIGHTNDLGHITPSVSTPITEEEELLVGYFRKLNAANRARAIAYLEIRFEEQAPPRSR